MTPAIAAASASFVVRFDFDVSPTPTEAWLDGLEDRLGHTVSARVGRGYSVTVWLDHVNAASAAAAAAAELDVETGWGNSTGTLVSVSAQTEADYEAAAASPGIPAIVGAADVAQILGVSRQRVHQLAQTAGFPAPITRIKMGPLWDELAILTFDSRWERKPGRPAAQRQPAAPSSGKTEQHRPQKDLGSARKSDLSTRLRRSQPSEMIEAEVR